MGVLDVVENLKEGRWGGGVKPFANLRQQTKDVIDITSNEGNMMSKEENGENENIFYASLLGRKENINTDIIKMNKEILKINREIIEMNQQYIQPTESHDAITRNVSMMESKVLGIKTMGVQNYNDNSTDKIERQVRGLIEEPQEQLK